jgi:hypothetical protein
MRRLLVGVLAAAAFRIRRNGGVRFDRVIRAR